MLPETTVVTALPPPLELFSIQQSSSSALPDPPISFIETPGAVVEDSIEEIHLLFDDSVRTPVIPLTLRIPFQDPRVYSFEHQLGLPVTPQLSRFPLQCPLPFTPLHWSHSGLFIDPGVLSFLGGFGASTLSHGGVGSMHCTYGFERVS